MMSKFVYVYNDYGGMRLLDVTDPTEPPVEVTRHFSDDKVDDVAFDWERIITRLGHEVSEGNEDDYPDPDEDEEED